MTPDLTYLLYKSAGRHFVTLSCVQYQPNDEAGKALIFSGFLVEIDETPPAAGSKSENQFYATFAANPEGYVRDLDGMSGGSVFSLHKRDAEQWAYTVIGVQSAWYKGQKVLAVCPFTSFGMAISEVIHEARRLSEEQFTGLE